MKTIYYNRDTIFKVTDDDFNKIMDQFDNGEHRVFIKSLQVVLTDKFLWAGNEPADKNIGWTHDGRKVFKKFGEWRFSESPELKPDMRYYPELTKDELPLSKAIALK